MKTKLRLLLNICLLSLTVSFTACEGDQGDIGPKGDTGIDGVAGSPGAVGAKGTGFDELTQHGNIEVTFSGSINEDEEFFETIDFLYMPPSGVSQNSSIMMSEGNLYFNLGRENKGPAVNTSGRTKGGGYKNNVWLNLIKTTDGVVLDYLEFYTDILTDDFKTFEIAHYNSSGNETFNPEITNYSYSPTTGKLIFDFSYTIPAVNSNTNHDITVTGKADVTVFEKIYSPG